MTNRQSNIIFYGVIALVIYGLGVNHFYPEFFENLSKSKEEISIQEAVAQGEHTKALPIYQQLVDKRISDNDENTIETADLYEGMAGSYAQLDNKVEEKAHYLKSLNIKLQLKKVNSYSVASTYFKLGVNAEDDKQFDQAQSYLEQSLAKRLGDTVAISEDEGVFEGYQNTQLRYKRLNNPDTIATFIKLGALHEMKQEYPVTKDYYERALAASKLTFGEDNEKTLEIMELLKQLTP
ncbi:tetratricopeptide repeat protein [Leucothrix arctica]|uniref:Tetratricopeptide repeat-like domain-containing protein n=1 Tax=Leucothrix arctica TaxID=1481894 RepID=A0A317CBL5_9GAMM|nr:tetratricopeptide repeat protein [Leucothrix arctica]PWQ95948.1 hypothetical protein DKT75_11245 [Leucothrix arctica]